MGYAANRPPPNDPAVHAAMAVFDNHMPDATNVHAIANANADFFAHMIGYALDRNWTVENFATHADATNQTVFAALLLRK